MAKKDEIVSQLSRLLAKQISLSDFSKWFLPYAWNIEEGDAAFDLAEAIDGQLVQFDMDSAELRAELEKIYASCEGILAKNVAVEIYMADDEHDEAISFLRPIIRSQGNPVAAQEAALILPRDESLAEYVSELRRSRSLQSMQLLAV
jgi:hypothetical protein